MGLHCHPDKLADKADFMDKKHTFVCDLMQSSIHALGNARWIPSGPVPSAGFSKRKVSCFSRQNVHFGKSCYIGRHTTGPQDKSLRIARTWQNDL